MMQQQIKNDCIVIHYTSLGSKKLQGVSIIFTGAEGDVSLLY